MPSQGELTAACADAGQACFAVQEQAEASTALLWSTNVAAANAHQTIQTQALHCSRRHWTAVL